MIYKWKENSCFQLSQVTEKNSQECVDMFVRLLCSICISYTLEKITAMSLLMAVYHFI